MVEIESQPRFHIPLIEPDRRFSRIRLSDKASPSTGGHTFAHERIGRGFRRSSCKPSVRCRYWLGNRAVP